jgi:N4-gp56 family major capsid protein
MASETSGAYFTANAVVDKTAVDTFIPEIWSDEVIAAYKKSLKMAPLVKRLPMVGKKGDTIHIPKPVRGSANAKAEATAVTIQANLEGDLDISINRHFEYSRLIEDIVDVQALASLRGFYTDDAGYALATQVDDDLLNCGTGFGDGTKSLAPTDGAAWENSNSYYVNASSGLALYQDDTVATGDNFSDLAFRDAIKILDDADVDMANRVLVIPPAARKTFMGIERFVSSDFRDPRTVQSGLIGEVYGVEIYVSSNCPVLETAAQNAGGSIDVRGCLFFHKDAIVLAEQMSVRSQTQYKQEYLADLFTADTIYGVEVYRPEAGLVIAIADE